MSAQDVGHLAGPILALAFFGWLCWALFRRKRQQSQPVEDEPEGSPYLIYTTEFDQIVLARNVPDVMLKANLGVPPGLPPNVKTWPARKAAVERIAESAAAAFAEAEAQIRPVLATFQGDLAMAVLIDQSGSMRDNILVVAANVRWLAGLFDKYAVPISVMGFTTAGWRGGAARRKWVAAGRPKRPGALMPAAPHQISRFRWAAGHRRHGRDGASGRTVRKHRR